MSLGTLTNIPGSGGFPANGLTFIDRDSLSYAISIFRHSFSASTARNRMPLTDCRSNYAELKVVVVSVPYNVSIIRSFQLCRIFALNGGAVSFRDGRTVDVLCTTEYCSS